MSNQATTPAPPRPAGAPSDWGSVVHGNSFSNAQRLAIWAGGTTPIPTGYNPSGAFYELGQNLLAADAVDTGSMPTIYVLVHGWAPGYLNAVQKQGGNLLWWGKEAYATVSGSTRWASDWAWSPVAMPTNPPFPVSGNGMFQSIMAYDSNAIGLAYSWIDDSATDYVDSHDYQSEANTHLNGIRLANALLEVITPEFWAQGGKIHLIGHSHGSKVCTVAAFTLQQAGKPVAHLTILDSPETTLTLASNGANLLGFYLEQMQIRDPSTLGPGTFVDNYTSRFGVGYQSSNSSSSLKNIVQVGLNPAAILSDQGYRHTYAAAWYGAAAAAAKSLGNPPVGLAWPPVPAKWSPAMNQTWPPSGVPSKTNQWLLAPGTTLVPNGSYVYGAHSLAVKTGSTSGNVTGDPSTGLTFLPNGTSYSVYTGTYTSDHSDQYGIAFDLEWDSPLNGDYLVVTAGGDFMYTLLVLDGRSAPIGKTSVAINSDVWDLSGTATVTIYFRGSTSVPVDKVTISNFRWISVSSPSGSLPRERSAPSAEPELAGTELAGAGIAESETASL